MTRKGRGFVMVGTDVPYAEAHNEGAKIRGSFRVASHTRKAHKVKAHTVGGRKRRAASRKAAKVQSHTREVNITIPQRQFIGPSPDVIKSVEREVFRMIDNIVQNL